MPAQTRCIDDPKMNVCLAEQIVISITFFLNLFKNSGKFSTLTVKVFFILRNFSSASPHFFSLSSCDSLSAHIIVDSSDQLIQITCVLQSELPE